LENIVLQVVAMPWNIKAFSLVWIKMEMMKDSVSFSAPSARQYTTTHGIEHYTQPLTLLLQEQL